MATIDWEQEYNTLANLVGTVLDEIQALKDETEELTQAAKQVRQWHVVDRCTARVLALQDTLDLWEDTDYV